MAVDVFIFVWIVFHIFVVMQCSTVAFIPCFNISGLEKENEKKKNDIQHSDNSKIRAGKRIVLIDMLLTVRNNTSNERFKEAGELC